MRYFALLALFVLAGCDNSPRLVVNGELLSGKRVADGAVFLGVPFAEPPLGELRWRAPQPLATRLAERDATTFAAACMQTMRIADWYRSMAEKFGGPADYYEDPVVSEDCLYLNVWTPTLDTDAQLPVMVWVHGGSNNSGWSYEPNYRGDVLAPQGVVVVTVAYRLGAFGFLSHPELQGPDAVANFGLYDIVAALQWVRDNIRKFGGDPERITVFGESSGAENVLALMFAEQAQGLLHRGILQSTAGYGLSMPSLDDEMQRGERLGELLEAASLNELRSVPADEVLRIYSENFEHHYHSPAIDSRLIVESTWDSIRAGRNTDLAMIIGANADEYRDRKATAEDYVCPSQMVAATRSSTGADARMYFFSRVREDRGGSQLGAYHGAEIPYVFGMHDSYMKTTKHDQELGNLMQQYWINFAATGDPNGKGLPAWPTFQGAGAELLELGDEVRAIPPVEPELCGTFQERYLQ